MDSWNPVNVLDSKYRSEPFNGPAHDSTRQEYYDAQLEILRMYELQNQFKSLDIADLYDDMTNTGLSSETSRDYLEFSIVRMTEGNLKGRQKLLDFDFIARIVDALTDVFQNAVDVARVAASIWGLNRLELTQAHYSAGPAGWYFGGASALWPTWAGAPIDQTFKKLTGDNLLRYLDKVEALLISSERRMLEFDSNAARGILHVKLNFTTVDGVCRAELTTPSVYRYQEVGAIYLKGMPADVSMVEVRCKDVRVGLSVGADGFLHCEASLQDPEFGGMTFSSDGGMAGQAPIFGLERDCLACASAGNQPIALSCHSDLQNFAVDCMLRVAGFNNPTY